ARLRLDEQNAALAEGDNVRAGAVVLDAVGSKGLRGLCQHLAPLIHDALGLEDRLVGVRLPLLADRLLEGERVDAGMDADGDGRWGNERGDGRPLNVADLPQRQRADDGAR